MKDMLLLVKIRKDLFLEMFHVRLLILRNYLLCYSVFHLFLELLKIMLTLEIVKKLPMSKMALI